MRGRISLGRGVVVVVGAALQYFMLVHCTFGFVFAFVSSCNGRPLGAQDLQCLGKITKS